MSSVDIDLELATYRSTGACMERLRWGVEENSALCKKWNEEANTRSRKYMQIIETSPYIKLQGAQVVILPSAPMIELSDEDTAEYNALKSELDQSYEAASNIFSGWHWMREQTIQLRNEGERWIDAYMHALGRFEKLVTKIHPANDVC